MEAKDSYKKGFKSLLISIPLGMLISVMFYFVWLKHIHNSGLDVGFSYDGMALLGFYAALIYMCTIIFLGVIVIVCLVFIILYIRKKQKKALTVAIILMIVMLFLSMRLLIELFK